MFDTKCYELAAAFLSDAPTINTPERVNQLAQVIQDAIEGEMAEWLEPTNLGDCVACDGYILDASEFPHCPSCARLQREGKPL